MKHATIKDTSPDQVRQERDEIYQLLGQLRKEFFLNRLYNEQGTISSQLVDLLNELRDHLGWYFTMEKSTGEMRETLLRAPRLSRKVESLQHEQEVLFAELVDICDKSETSLRQKAPHYLAERCEREFHQFEEQFVTHQTREAELVVKALYDDIGVGD